MTAITSSLVWRCGDATENYKWIKAVSDALTAAGVQLTGDTGQIDLTGSTIALPTINSSNTSITPIGYQIRKLESANLPTIYIRIDYGYRRTNTVPPIATNGNIPVISISAASATNGAGALAGNQFGFTANSSAGFYLSGSSTVAAAPPTFPRMMYVSSDGKNYLTISIDPGLQAAVSINKSLASIPLVFCLERTADANTFAYDSEGMLMYVGGGDSPTGTTLYQFQWVNFPGNHRGWLSTGNVPVLIPPAYTQSPYGDIQLFPIFVTIPTAKACMRSMVYYYINDLSDGGLVTADIFGETHTYLASGQYSYLSAPGGNGGLAKPALRFE